MGSLVFDISEAGRRGPLDAAVVDSVALRNASIESKGLGHIALRIQGV